MKLSLHRSFLKMYITHSFVFFITQSFYKIKSFFDLNRQTQTHQVKGSFSFLPYIVIFLFFLIYLCLGIFIVAPAEHAVITRFGKYNRVATQGPHWYPLFIEDVVILNTEKLNSSAHGAPMLTKDENIVIIDIEVQYRISDISKKLFKFIHPERALFEAADSSMRQIIGRSTLDFIVTIGKEQLAYEIKEQLQMTLDAYDIGFYVAAVVLKEARVPSEVKSSFDDVIRAQEEKEQLKHQAEAFANKIVPEAHGNAAQMLEGAHAYKKEVILLAQGEVIRFELLLEQYEKAPDITRTRIYITAMESILHKTSKVLLDIGDKNSLVYIPIDRMLSEKSRVK